MCWHIQHLLWITIALTATFGVALHAAEPAPVQLPPVPRPAAFVPNAPAANAPAPNALPNAAPSTRPANDLDAALAIAVHQNNFAATRNAIARGADVNYHSEKHELALVNAVVHSRDAKMAELLLDNGADINGQTDAGGAALHYVRWPDVAAILIRRGADVNLRDRVNGYTPLHRAAENGNEAMAQVLLANGAEVNALAKHGETPLLIAAATGGRTKSAVTMEKLLLDAGADVNAASEEGETPLRAARAKGRDALVEFLASKGGSETGHRPKLAPPTTLEQAVRRGDQEAVRKLLAAGAAVNATDKNGQTSLHIAARFGHEDVVAYLVSLGADWRARDRSGDTALAVAVREGHVDTARLLLGNGAMADAGGALLASAARAGNRPMLELLLAAGADLNAPSDSSGFTPLFGAVYGNWRKDGPELVELMLKRGAKVEVASRFGWTPVLWAVRTGSRRPIIEALIQRGANVQVKNTWGETPVQWAVRLGDADVLKLLLENGADVAAKDTTGKSAMDYAQELDNRRGVREAVMKLLTAQGAKE